ncbi:uncharacterized protein [Lolium perenne]|uniref:uncharacterized protein n=1 Tax=Lolium perenne TaxID=4522 RepID=UPI003A98F0E1
MDRISALSDDMLLHVLAHLGCARAAAQSSLLSRRWRSLCLGMTDLTFRGLAPATVEAALPSFAASPRVSTLDIAVSSTHTPASANSLLRAAAQLSPANLLFTLQHSSNGYLDGIKLPCFQRTASIEIHTERLGVKLLPDGEFAALESLAVTGQIDDLRALLKRCPRLRELSVRNPDMHLSPTTTLPPASEFPALDKLSLSGKIVDLGPLLNNCKRLRELSVTQRDDTRLLRITLPLSGEFPVLEKLSLSGNIANFGTILNQCPRLRVLGVTFRGMALGSIEAGLTALEAAARLGLMLSLLCVQIPWRDDVDAARFNSLLCSVARLSPHEFIFIDSYEGVKFSTFDTKVNADLPCLPRATSMSIAMTLKNVWFTTSPASDFLALKRLYLSGHCGIVDIGTLVTRCPGLQELNVTVPMSNITVHSPSLQKVYFSHNMDKPTECHSIDIVTPMLKQLILNVHAARDMGVSVSTPALDKFSWRSTYTPSSSLLFGSWRLQIMGIETFERSYLDNSDDTYWQPPPRFHQLCLHLNAGNHLDGEMNFAQEIEKLPVTNFSVVELVFKYEQHAYGAFVLQFLQLRRIRTTMKKLKVYPTFWRETDTHMLTNAEKTDHGTGRKN